MADKKYLDWPFLSPQHRQLALTLDAWATRSISQRHEKDVDAACRQLVTQLGEAGWLKYAIGGTDYGGAGDAIGTRVVCLIRETLARYSASAPA